MVTRTAYETALRDPAGGSFSVMQPADHSGDEP